MTKFWSYLLLLSFAFILTPKVVFHDHDHHVESENDQTPSVEEDCFVCNFDYTSLSAPIIRPLNADYQFLSKLSSEIEFSLIALDKNFTELRGPPSRS